MQKLEKKEEEKLKDREGDITTYTKKKTQLEQHPSKSASKRPEDFASV